MTAEASDNKFQAWLRTLPRWKQIAVLSAIILPLAFGVDFIKEKLSDSPQATAFKQELYPLQRQLEASASVGYLTNQGDMSDAISSIMNRYNTLSDEQRASFNATSLRFCLIAVFNLNDGMNEVAKYKTWLSKDKYLAAVSACE